MEYSLWEEATRDITAEASVRREAMVRSALTEQAMPFLALASTKIEYIHRKALMADRLSTIAMASGASLKDVEAMADRMWLLMTEATTKTATTMECGNCGHKSTDHSEGLRCSCGCTDFSPTSSAKEARLVTAEGEGSGPFS